MSFWFSAIILRKLFNQNYSGKKYKIREEIALKWLKVLTWLNASMRTVLRDIFRIWKSCLILFKRGHYVDSQGCSFLWFQMRSSACYIAKKISKYFKICMLTVILGGFFWDWNATLAFHLIFPNLSC